MSGRVRADLKIIKSSQYQWFVFRRSSPNSEQVKEFDKQKGCWILGSKKSEFFF